MLGSPIYRVSAEGGAATPVTNVRQTSEASPHGNPSFLPDGRHFLFLAFIGPTTGSVYVGSLDSSDVKLLLRSNSATVFSPPGYVLYLRDATLIAQSFDVGTLSTRGQAAAVADGVGRLFMDRSFTASDNGVLLYRPGVSEQSRLTWVNRAGQTQGLARPPVSIVRWPYPLMSGESRFLGPGTLASTCG
jgi:hypothetical protein